MITFSYLDKSKTNIWLPKLFDILYDNMSIIAPGKLSYEDEKANWISTISSAIKRDARQIILCFDGDSLAGFLQYYIVNSMLMIEEVQLSYAYQRTTAFYRFCKYLQISISESIEIIEAYADKRNHNSISLMKQIGMEVIEEDASSPFLHLRGNAKRIKTLLK